MDGEESIDLSTIEGFDWDHSNFHKNKVKHNVRQSECEEVFFNKPLIIVDDPEHSSEQELRYKVLGVTTRGRKLLLAITFRSNKIRIITARNQTKKERTFFEAMRNR